MWGPCLPSASLKPLTLQKALDLLTQCSSKQQSPVGLTVSFKSKQKTKLCLLAEIELFVTCSCKENCPKNPHSELVGLDDSISSQPVYWKRITVVDEQSCSSRSACCSGDRPVARLFALYLHKPACHETPSGLGTTKAISDHIQQIPTPFQTFCISQTKTEPSVKGPTPHWYLHIGLIILI